jgi:hypothetical protein
MEEKIRSLVEEIQTGNTFDAHVIIEQLKERFRNIYEENQRDFTSIELYHSSISKMIKDQPNVEYLSGEHYSRNVNGNYTLNALYKKK